MIAELIEIVDIFKSIARRSFVFERFLWASWYCFSVLTCISDNVSTWVFHSGPFPSPIIRWKYVEALVLLSFCTARPGDSQTVDNVTDRKVIGILEAVPRVPRFQTCSYERMSALWRTIFSSVKNAFGYFSEVVAKKIYLCQEVIFQ